MSDIPSYHGFGFFGETVEEDLLELYPEVTQTSS